MLLDKHIAIVGIGCQYSGAHNIAEFWCMLGNASAPGHEDEGNSGTTHGDTCKDETNTGKTNHNTTGTKNEWNNQLYGISDSEAASVRLKHRLVLDCVSMAVEDGGFTKQQLDGSNTGVYIESSPDDNRDSRGTGDVSSGIETEEANGNLATRVSGVFDLRGPRQEISTASSPPLLAVHTACQAIAMEQCGMAICCEVLGGEKMTGREGHTDQAATNVPRVGCGVVILKEYTKALSDGNMVWGLIRTGCNQDGRTATPITAPSSDQQMALLEKIYEQTSTDPNKIQYIEVNGTGRTEDGHSEVDVLGKFLLRARSTSSTKERNAASSAIDEEKREHDMTELSEERVRVGTVHSTIGHPESAASIASIIKVLLMMSHGRYVRSSVTRGRAESEFSRGNLKACYEEADWPRSVEEVRVACIYCLGPGGSGSLAIVTRADQGQKERTAQRSEYRNISFLQKRKYKMYEKDNADPSLVLITDMDLPIIYTNVERWKSIIQHLVETYKVLRFVFLREVPGYPSVIKVLRSEEVKVNFLMVDERDVSHKQRLSPDKLQYRFDLEKECALRVLFAKRTDGTAIMRWLMHVVIFDLDGYGMLFQDVVAYAFHRLRNTPVPPPPRDIDVAAVVTKFVQPLLPELEAFWSSAVPSDIQMVTLEKKGEHELSYEQFETTKRQFPSSDFNKIQNFLRPKRITLFEFFVSLYQVVLHRRTGKRNIPVLTSVNMRYRIPDLAHAWSPCGNNVPLVADVADELPLDEFLIINARKIRDILKHGQYPFFMLLKKMKTEETRQALRKHMIILDDITFASQLRPVGSREPRVHDPVHGGLHGETRLFIEIDHKSRTISLVLLHNPVAIGTGTAYSMLSEMLALVNQTMAQEE